MHTAGRQNMLPKPAIDGLAISYDTYASPQHYQPAYPSKSMGWDSNEMPIQRDGSRKPFVKAYDAETDTSTRLDSVLDAYTNMYSDYLDDPEDDEDDEPVEVELAPQRREPWDQRGKNGLYGGGGRGADDRETGWVREYALADDQGQGGGNRSDEDEGDAATPKMRRDNFDHQPYENERRRSSSDSSYGPVTPVNDGFDRGYNNNDDSVYNSRIVPNSKAPYRPARDDDYRAERPRSSSGRDERPRSSAGRDGGERDRVPPRTSSRPRSKSNTRQAPATPERPALPTRNTGSTIGHKSSQSSTSLSLFSDSTARLKKKAAPLPASAAHPTITTPFNPALSAAEGDGEAPEMKRKKSVGGSFKFGRSKKAPVISNPILPDGFVESLGMETFALTPGCSAPSHAISPRIPKKKEKEAAPAPRPRKNPMPPQVTQQHSKSASTHTLSYGGPPEVIRTPMDALRQTGPSMPPPVSNVFPSAQTPNDFRQEINDAFRRLSHDSMASNYAPTLSTAQAEQGKRQYFDSMRAERGKERSEVQAGRGPAPLPQTKGATIYPNSQRDQGPPPSRGHNSQPSNGRYNAPQNGYSSYDDGDDSYGVEALDDSGPSRPSDHSSYSAESPGLDSGSDYESTSVSRGTTSNWDHVRTQSGGYGNNNSNRRPSDDYQSSGYRRPSDQDYQKSEAGDLVWGAMSPGPTPAAQPVESSPFQSMSGSNLFRNPFEMQAAGSGSSTPRRTGWQ